METPIQLSCTRGACWSYGVPIAPGSPSAAAASSSTLLWSGRAVVHTWLSKQAPPRFTQAAREWPSRARLNETAPREWPSRARFSETTGWTPSQRIWSAADQRRAAGTSSVRRDSAAAGWSPSRYALPAETCQGPPIDADQRSACGSTPAPASSAARCTAMTAATAASVRLGLSFVSLASRTPGVFAQDGVGDLPGQPAIAGVRQLGAGAQGRAGPRRPASRLRCGPAAP